MSFRFCLTFHVVFDARALATFEFSQRPAFFKRERHLIKARKKSVSLSFLISRTNSVFSVAYFQYRTYINLFKAPKFELSFHFVLFGWSNF